MRRGGGKCYACTQNCIPCVNAPLGCLAHVAPKQSCTARRSCSSSRGRPCPFKPLISAPAPCSATTLSACDTPAMPADPPVIASATTTSTFVASAQVTSGQGSTAASLRSATAVPASDTACPDVATVCVTPRCFTMVLGVGLCTLCSSGSQPCARKCCTNRADSGGDGFCRTCRPFASESGVARSCRQCLALYKDGRLDLMDVRPRQTSAWVGGCCKRHAPTIARIAQGLKATSRQSPAKILTKKSQLKTTSSTRAPQRHKACQELDAGVPCCGRAQGSTGRCKKHSNWYVTGRYFRKAACVALDAHVDATVPRNGLNGHKKVAEITGSAARFRHTCS